MPVKKRLWQFFQIALTVGVLYWLFRDAGKRESMLHALKNARWSWLLLGLGWAMVGEVTGILRWRIFLQAQGIHASLGTVSRWFFIGLFFNIFLPGTTGGDLARLYYLWRDYPQHRQGAFLTLVADRLIGLIPLILAAALGTTLNYRWLTQTPATSGLLMSTLVFCGGMAVVIGLSFFFSAHSKIPQWLPGHQQLAGLAKAWQLFTKEGHQFSWALFLSMPVLFSYYGGFYCASRAVDAGATLGQIFSLMPIVTIITSLPISVAGLGVREGLFERLLGDLCGTPAEVAALVSLLGFLMFTFYGVIGAVVYLFSQRMDRAQLAEMEAIESAAAET
ncbi:MAG: lysylphosphatidylglycerol synthase transmembrane domain-containing protein [Chthoniobacterales bacterium]